MFLSNHLLHVGDALYLRMKLNHKREMFNCHVCREVVTPDGQTMYGCLFDELSERESDSLCAFIFEQQRLELQRLAPPENDRSDNPPE